MPQEPKPGIFTTEFYVTIVSTIIGILVSVNVVPLDRSNDLIKAISTIIGAIITVAPSVTYIWGRSYLKGKSMQTTVIPPANP